MTVQQFVSALNVLTPGAQWSVSANAGQVDLTTLHWLDSVQTRPTDAAIIAQVG